MKLFLLQDVKGRGKAGDTIELAPGFALFLLRTNKALSYDRSPKEIQAIIENEEAARQAAFELATELAAKLNQTTLTFTGHLNPRGSLQKAITKKDIIESLLKLGINLVDAKMLEMDANITAVGLFDIPVRVHKDVRAHIRIKAEAN